MLDARTLVHLCIDTQLKVYICMYVFVCHPHWWILGEMVAKAGNSKNYLQAHEAHKKLMHSE